MSSRKRPSARWTSFESWRYDGMDTRLEKLIQSIRKDALVEHARIIARDDSMTMSVPFSAGQFWCCFELASEKTEHLLIARVRLPRHPESSNNVTEQSEMYGINCEVATMRFLHENVKNALCPRLFAHEPPGSQWAEKVGASYMMIEGFYGNTLQDVEYNICNLTLERQEHITRQWTNAQAELAAFIFPSIGSIAEYRDDGKVVIGPLAVAAADNFDNAGPFHNAYDYFIALADSRTRQAREDDSQQTNNTEEEGNYSANFNTIGPLVFKEIVISTKLFKHDDLNSHFPLNHMDLGTQNILVDDDFNFLAIIDWEFAQTAPWEVNHFPMPFPLISSDSETETILTDPKHIAHRNVLQQTRAQKLYEQSFCEAEERMAAMGKPLGRSLSKTLRSPAARIARLLEKIGVFQGMEEELTYEIVRLAYGLEGVDATAYIAEIARRLAENGR